MDMKAFLKAVESVELNNDDDDDNTLKQKQNLTDISPEEYYQDAFRNQRKQTLEIRIREAGSKKILIKVSRIDKDVKDLAQRFKVPIIVQPKEPKPTPGATIWCNIVTNFVCGNDVCRRRLTKKSQLVICQHCKTHKSCCGYCDNVHKQLCKNSVNTALENNKN